MSRRPFGVVTSQGFVPTAVLDTYAVKGNEGSRQVASQQSFDGVSGLLKPKLDPTVLAGLLDMNTAHARACRAKAQDVAGAGWRLDKVKEDASEDDRDTLMEFFDELPPPRNALDDDDVSDVFEAAQLDYELVGRGALELIRTDHSFDGAPETLVHVPAHTLRLHRDKKRFVQVKSGVRHWFRWVGADIDVNYETGQWTDPGKMLPKERGTEIVWWRQYHPHDLVYGGPDILPALGAVHGDNARRDYNIQFFSNWGIPAYAVFVTGDFDPGGMVNSAGEPVEDDSPDAAMTELEWHIEQLLADVRIKPHSSLVFTIPTRQGLEDGEVKIEFKPLSTDVKEASFRLYRTDNREEILSSHGMSAAIAGVFDAGAANRESMQQYKRSIVQPRQRRLERIVNRHIVVGGFGIHGWKWRLNQIDTRDLEKELDMWVSMLDRGAVTLRQFIRHFSEPFGLTEPDAPEGDPLLDERRRLPGDPGVQPVDDTAVALRSLRDDLVAVAVKQGADPERLSRLLT